MTQSQIAKIAWNEAGVPVATQFDDPYFSVENGLAETHHVFLDGNDLPDRFKPAFHIGELGFGTGLNMLATYQMWRASGAVGEVFYTSFEAFPMAIDDVEKSLANFPDIQDVAPPFLTAWRNGERQFSMGGVSGCGFNVTVIEGDARQCVASWDQKADAWYLDGFSPAKNPELWGEGLMSDVAKHTNPKGTFATYTAAGFVRRALDGAGFDVQRSSGYGRKRHMSKGVLRDALQG